MKHLAAAALTVCFASEAFAEPQTYLIAVGNNAVPEAWAEDNLAPLRYADDDAFAFAEFASEAGWKATLLAVPDKDTQARYPSLVESTRPPSVAELERALTEVSAQIERDAAAGHESELIFFFSGHGRKSQPALALLDGEITQAFLYERVISVLPAQHVHLLIDACHAESVVRARGEEPEEIDASVVPLSSEQIDEWLEERSLAKYPRVGAIIATAPDAQTHEWDVLARGIFSHEILSGLRGAADVNGDQRIEYSELDAFVAAANRDVPSPKARLNVVTKRPAINERAPIVDLSRSKDLAWVDGIDHTLGRFFVEDERGTRIAEAHVEPGHRVALALPANETLTFVTAKGEMTARLAKGGRLSIGGVEARPASLQSRGALASALERGLFASPYGPLYYRGFVDQAGAISVTFDQPSIEEERPEWPVWLSFGTSGALLITSGVLGGMALDARSDWNGTDLQLPAQEARERYDDFRLGFWITLAGGLVASAAGTSLLVF